MTGRYNFSSFSILIVDDNPFVGKIVHRMCRSFGFASVTAVDNVEAALKHLATDRLDMAICDWEMSPLDGSEFVKRIRGNPEGPLRFLPIIMLTSHTDVSRIRTARDLGITEFLAKPLSAKTLLTRICSIVDTPRPFIETPTYFGPDRRRRQDPKYKGPERRGVPLPLTDTAATDAPSRAPDAPSNAAARAPAASPVSATA